MMSQVNSAYCQPQARTRRWDAFAILAYPLGHLAIPNTRLSCEHVICRATSYIERLFPAPGC